jgi:dimethylargininase
LLDAKTVFATQAIASTKCFEDQRIILVPEGEEGAANIVRYNDVVFLSAGYPKSEALLKSEGFNVVMLDTSEAAKVDGGLSCMSLRF